MDAEGNFIITWENWYMGGEKQNVYARTFDNTGTPLEEFQVNSDVLAPTSSPFPSAAMYSQTDFVIVWQNLADIYAKHYTGTTSDTTPPTVEITSPRDGSWVSGIIPITITATDESLISIVEIQINRGDWSQCLLDNGSWRYDFDPSGLLENSEINILARATDMSENANVGHSSTHTLVFKLPVVTIYHDGAFSQPGDVLNLRVNVLNTRSNPMDLYIAGSIAGNFYWYPLWNMTPSATQIERGIWDEIILSVPYNPAIKGTFTFYAAILDQGGLDLVDLNSIILKLN